MAMLIVDHAQGLSRNLRGVILRQQPPFKSCVTATPNFNILMEDEEIKTRRCPYMLARKPWDSVKAEKPCKKMKKHNFHRRRYSPVEEPQKSPSIKRANPP